MTSTEKKKNQNQNSWKGLLVWILIALLLRWQAVEPRWIPSGSMIPTLQIQDRILIEKITPRIIVPIQYSDRLLKRLILNKFIFIVRLNVINKKVAPKGLNHLLSGFDKP